MTAAEWRAAVEALPDPARAALRAVLALPHEDWCCAMGCAYPGENHCQGTEADCECLVSMLRRTVQKALA